MMAKYLKLAIAPDGSIVSRETGAKSRVKGLNVVDNRVYKAGRLYGYLGKPTASQQAKIEKVSSQREKRQTQQAYKKMYHERGLIEPTGDFTMDASIGSAVAQIYTRVGRGWMDVSKMNQSVLNYANTLKAGIKEGKLTKAQADALYEKYMKASSNDERRKIWNSTSALFDKYGVKYKIEKARISGEDDLVDISKETGWDVKEYWRQIERENLHKVGKLR